MQAQRSRQSLETALAHALSTGDEAACTDVGAQWAATGKSLDSLRDMCLNAVSSAQRTGTCPEAGKAVSAATRTLTAWSEEAARLQHLHLRKVVHDLVTPLQTIVSLGHLLATSEEMPQSQRVYLDSIVDEALRLSKKLKEVPSQAGAAQRERGTTPVDVTATRRDAPVRVETRTTSGLASGRDSRPRTTDTDIKKLLIADDDDALRQIVRATLTSDRYEILEAADGPDILAAARKHLPDLILLDVHVPGLDGFRVCEILKEDPLTAGATVVMLTGDSGSASRRRAKAAGAEGYLTKPFSPLALIQTVDDVLGAG